METTTTTARTTTIRTTTTTQDTGIGPGPTAPPIDEIEGDTILILAEDKAMLHNWPRGGGAKFNTLQNSYNDFNSKWEMNGYWVKDACSVQFQGESYLIGGAYNCDGGTANCEHVNIQKAVMKLSTTKCGLEIVWDGNDKALPFDMKEHSCAVYNKRINNNDFKPHVMLCSPDDTANDPHNDKEYIDKYCWSTRYMSRGDMYWSREPNLNERHIKGAMVQHKGRLVILGGTGTDRNHDSPSDTNKLEWLDQSAGKWRFGQQYPLKTEGHSMVSAEDYLYVFGGLNYDEDYDEWQDSALFNTHRVYKNRDPTQNYQWETHANLKRARAKHNTVWMGGQIYHVAGYAKDYSTSPSTQTGRRVEKWEDKNGSKKLESEDVLFNYVSPQSFIVSENWYKNICGINYGK